MIKKVLNNILPNNLLSFLKSKKNLLTSRRKIEKIYNYDKNRYLKFSDSLDVSFRENLIGKIIRKYHVIEKGLTMPNMRGGFGQNVINGLILDCNSYIQYYGLDDSQVKHAISVIIEYQNIHADMNYSFDKDFEDNIFIFLKSVSLFSPSCQRELTKLEYFDKSHAPFNEFAKSRFSLRHFTDQEIPYDSIVSALELAQTAPSACNRQTSRVYLYTQKSKIGEILDTQGGNRGFGHLANKLIIITSDVKFFSSDSERNQCYVDGGIYAMNLLYSLHHYGIGACILNCSNSVSKDLKLRKMCDISDSEVFIAMIACGIPPEEFKVARSERYEFDVINTIN